MIATENILPIKEMLGKDWNAIFSGFVVSIDRDWLSPKENQFAGQIIKYLLNRQLDVSHYTKYSRFYFSANVYIAEPIFYYPERVSILYQGNNILACDLEVYMPDAKRFSEVNKHEALRMTAQLLLDSVPKYLFGRDDFDGEKFYEDILPIIQPIADGTRTFRDEEFPL